jgi:hypothetical protein
MRSSNAALSEAAGASAAAAHCCMVLLQQATGLGISSAVEITKTMKQAAALLLPQ